MDKRTRAQQRADDIDITPTKLLAEIERLTGERDTAIAEKDEFLSALQRRSSASAPNSRTSSAGPPRSVRR